MRPPPHVYFAWDGEFLTPSPAERESQLWAFSSILKDIYLPAIRQQVETNTILLERLFRG